MAASPPRALIVSIYGLYAREQGGWLSVATLVRLMAALGVDEPAVRSAISRLKRREILCGEQVDGTAGYSLSDDARTILDDGDRRIFARERASLTDGWLLAVFSVPESERAKRHQLRSRLSWLGFGTVASGVWIAPAPVEVETRDVLERAGLAPYVSLFSAAHLGFTPTAAQVPIWWDLPRLQGMHEQFLHAYAPLLASCRRRRAISPEDAFAGYVAALTEWRRLPYADPGLPLDVLPAKWPGSSAADTFFALRALLADAAHTFVTA